MRGGINSVSGNPAVRPDDYGFCAGAEVAPGGFGTGGVLLCSAASRLISSYSKTNPAMPPAPIRIDTGYDLFAAAAKIAPEPAPTAPATAPAVSSWLSVIG